MDAWDDRERAALVALLRVRPDRMTWPQIAAEVADSGSARAVWDRLRPQAPFETEIDTAGGQSELDVASMDIESWRLDGFRFLTFQDADYPAQLREVQQMPPVLFTQGTLQPGEAAVSVVGSRKASPTALRTARDIATGLSDAGVTVLSGLAEGIDTAAHSAALNVGGRTVAIIGTGIRKYFPAANRALQIRIATSGLVVSQFWPDAPPTKQTFPMRNATMSAYGRATIVVEAGEQSGARIQARSAVAHGRPVILLDAVASGTNWGRSLLGEPGVYPAANAHEAVERALGIVTDRSHLAKLLAMVGE
ncbi:DNA-processing protein DprA [Actinokineospora iranica]|uniref:DNA-processing protein DprA n=1 Tax=Actinokineospora iranica TaxID=1271860 RepID=UPI001E4D405C|nr:DNA-processing protein DprA [Actinokineospora iranica]